MAKYDIDESVEGCFDISVEVDFLQPLDIRSHTELLRLIADMLTQGLNANRFEGIVSVQITLDKVFLQLRYFTKPKLDALGIQHTGYEEPLGLSYLFYLFANINKRYPIGKHPFPINLQDYIDYF